MRKFINEKFNSRGITLISLVVTIVVLIILSTVTIYSVLGEGGLIDSAEKKTQSQANRQAIDDTKIDELEEQLRDDTGHGEYEEGGIVETPDTTNPTVNVTVSSKGYDTITVSVTASDEDSGLGTNPVYAYYIGTSPSNITLKHSGGASYAFDGLKQKTQYYIKVTVADTAGNTGTGNTDDYTDLCPACNAVGKRQQAVDCLPCEATGNLSIPCTTCSGSGVCPTCKGTGVTCSRHADPTQCNSRTCSRYQSDCGCSSGKCAGCNGNKNITQDCPNCVDGFYYEEITCMTCEGAGC